MIKELIIRSLRFIKKLRWNFQRLQIQRLIFDASKYQLDRGVRLLIIAPHADDELIGCYALLRNHKQNVKVLYCSFLGHNYSEHNKSVRQTEFQSYMRSVGCDYTISSPQDVRTDINDILETFSPDLIALPSYIDWHPEHRIVNEILAETENFPHHSKILWYHISLPLPAKYVNSLTEMSYEQHLEKWRFLTQFYKSQLGMDIKRFRFIEKIFKQDSTIPEVYYLQNADEWREKIKKMHLFEDELNDLKSTLGNIKLMFKRTEYYYNKII